MIWKCVSVVLETIVPVYIGPLSLNICHCLITYHCGRACIDLHHKYCQDVNMQSLSESNNGTSTGESVIFWTAVFPLMRKAIGLLIKVPKS